MGNFRIYFGGKYDNKLLINNMRDVILAKLNVKAKEYRVGQENITRFISSARWSNHHVDTTLYQRAKMDFEDLRSSNMAVFFSPVGYGTCSEMGFCLGAKIPIISYQDEVFANELIKYEYGCNDPLPFGMLSRYKYYPGEPKSKRVRSGWSGIGVVREYEKPVSDPQQNDEGYIVCELETVIHLIFSHFKKLSVYQHFE